jgi:hypothetical protein
MITYHLLFSLTSSLKVLSKTCQVHFLSRINRQQHRKLNKWALLVSRLEMFLRLTTGHLKSLLIYSRVNKNGSLRKQLDLIWLKTLKNHQYREKWQSLLLLMKLLLQGLLWLSFRLLFLQRLISQWRMPIIVAMLHTVKEKWNLGLLRWAVQLSKYPNWKIKELSKDKRLQPFFNLLLWLIIITLYLFHDLLETIEEWEALLMLIITWAFVKKKKRY